MFHPDGRGLSVYVFKSLTIEYNGRPVNTHRGSTKVIQLLLLLLLSGGDGVPKHALVSAIYGQEEEGWADYNQYVNNLIYRLKKLLTEWEMDGATVEISRSICYFRADFPVTVDALEFRRKSLEALASEDDGRLAALEEAFQMYTDTFLEEFSTDLWVIQRKREIRKLYFRVTEALGEGYRASGSLNRARNIYHQAAVWFPFESFRLHEMDCLIGLNDYEGAYALYTDIRQSYAGAMEVMPEREIQKRLAIVEKRLGHSARTLPEIVALLRTNARTGAFYCHYAVFVSFCQILARLAERSGRPLSLMLCTWTDGGVSKPGADRTEQQMSLLRAVIGRVFRAGDVYTQFGSRQFLIILSGTGRENGTQIFTRLLREWNRQEDAFGELSYSLETLQGF